MILITTAWAGVGPAPEPSELWTRWGGDALAPLVLLALMGGLGLRRLGTPARSRLFAAAILALAIALVSPLDALADALFSAHMVQHLLLVQVAAPLLVLARPEAFLPRALPRAWRRYGVAVWRRSRWALGWLLAPGVVFTVHLVAIWAWHAPGPYQAALERRLVHALEHACFLGTAVLFWRAVLHPRARSAIGHGGAVLFVFATALHTGVLGVLIGFTPAPWYPHYARTTAAFGLSPLEDQQLAGAIMWVPGGLLYAGVALGLVADWMRSAERRRRRQQQQQGSGL